MGHKTIVISTAGVLIGIGLNGFIIPHHLLDGGVVGLSLLLSYLWGIKPGLTFLAMNLAIYLLVLKFERTYFFYGLWGVLICSLMIDLLSPLKGHIHLPAAASSMIGGVFIGLGVGIMLRHRISHDGIDLLALWLSKYLSVNTAIIIFFFDIVIIGSGMIIFQEKNQMYSFLTIFTTAMMTLPFTLFKSVDWYLNKDEGH
ncbi:hypothetical protein EWH99_07550 [Sporolactobacillus sp. THM7-7]|nr:hypothetical protein EWH99_07550 [Sporolactobacillus sp. THM7-7]